MKYEYKKVKGYEQKKFIEDGHTMFEEDVLQRLKRLAHLEEQLKQANGVEQNESNCNISLVMRSAFKEAYEKWYNTKDDAELGNWLFAKCKGITS